MAATTDTLTEDVPVKSPLDRLREAFGRLSNQQRIVLMVVAAALVAGIIGATMWSKQPDFRVLFSNISEKDGGAIIAVLEQQNVPHKLSDNGAILVPVERVHEIRLRLATQGLPRGGSVGFELMENQKFGISQFAEQVNYQRGLEGELSRTIQSIGAIQAARVHLAIPKPSVFIREDQKPTASVLLNLYPGRVLDAPQVAGITHLVSSSVPGLNSTNVTVIDQSGSILSQIKSKLTEAGLDPTQIKYVREMEASIVARIEEILKPVLGDGNYKVQVAADVDFSQSEQTAESYRPNNTPENSSIRSQQNNETASVNQSAGGVPGALTNQPPVPATAPLTSPATGSGPTANNKQSNEAPGKVDAAGVTAPLQAAGQPISTTKSNTVNYEIDKTIRHTRQSIGAIRRLSAAVVVNYRSETGKDGKQDSKALSEAEMKQINELVREAMGFSKDRGDSISVANAPFSAPKPSYEVPLWKDPENIGLAKELVKYVFIFGILVFVYLKIAKPALETMFPPPSETEEDEDAGAASGGGRGLGSEEGEGDEFGEEKVDIDHYAIKLQKARDIAQSDPKMVANLIKEWMGANGG